MMASAVYAPVHINGTTTPSSTADDDELYSQLLRLRDVVIAGKHSTLKLPQSAIEQLKASLNVEDAQAPDAQVSSTDNATNGLTSTTNETQLQHHPSVPSFNGLPGLQTASPAIVSGAVKSPQATRTSAASLDPIFLQKSDSLVRAEGQLKRQRLDRDLQAQIDQRKHSSRDRDPGAEAPSPIDIDLVLLNALERVRPVSGLKPAERAASASTSFDENDYYSSQVQSAFTADFESFDSVQASKAAARRHGGPRLPTIPGSSDPKFSRRRPHVYTDEPADDAYELEDEDEEYSPPDPAAFDDLREDESGMQQDSPPEDDDADYEPGEIAEESVPEPQYRAPEPTKPAPRGPVIRNNHLTHIAAPQPNRVSPLATAKGPSYETHELELVDGRPEMVAKSTRRQHMASRASSASPSGNGANGSGKKKRPKKRKRDFEPQGRPKKRRERQTAGQPPASPRYHEPYIKPEPVSPPPFANVNEHPPYVPQHAQQRPTQIDLVSPRHVPHVQHVNEPYTSGLRYEVAQPVSPAVGAVPSPSMYRPVQRDARDLRRVASMHYAQRPASPPQPMYSPVGPYRDRAVSMAYGEPRHAQAQPPAQDYTIPQRREMPAPEPVHETMHYARVERSRSPPQRSHNEPDPYLARAASPAIMPPPAPSRRQVMDQYGNRYWIAEPVAAPPQTAPRGSVAPIESQPQPNVTYERAPSRMSTAYGQPPQQPVYYEPVQNAMPPPAPPSRNTVYQDPRYCYVDTNAPVRYADQAQYTHAPTSPAYRPMQVEAPTSPVHQAVRGYDQMPPPPSRTQPPMREPTSPAYAPTGYAQYPEPSAPPQPGYYRHASVAPAPVQYMHQQAPAPVRAVSVMPGTVPNGSYGAPIPQQPQQYQPQQRAYSQAPQDVRYVDQYGNEVFARGVRQVGDQGHWHA